MSVPIISRRDTKILLGIATLTTIAWLVPERYWLNICQRLSSIAGDAVGDDPDQLQQGVQQTIGDRNLSLNLSLLHHHLASEQLLSKLQVLRAYHPLGWHPSIQLQGSEYIQTALQTGQGVILWVGHFLGGNLVAKMALHQAGFAVHHLSHIHHGFAATTRFGSRYLNRIQTAIEDRYLAERMILSPDNSVPVMLSLAQKLRKNQVISITAYPIANNPTKVRFLNGYLHLAGGAVMLAQVTKAALLPVFPYRQTSGEWMVRVEAPLEIPQSLPNRSVIEAVAQHYATLLEPYVLQYPDQWMGWLSDVVRESI